MVHLITRQCDGDHFGFERRRTDMSAESEDVFERNQLLQACFNDLVSILALPGVWHGREAAHVLASVLEALLGILDLDFGYARLSPLRDESCVEVVRMGVRRDPGVDADHVRQAMAIWGGLGPRLSPRLVPDPIGDGDVRVASYRLGAQDELGVLFAASTRPDFPTQTEALLLQVAVNQAVIGLQEARRFEEQRSASQEIKDELAAELGAMTRLHEFGSLLLTNTELPTIFEAALDATIALQRADMGMAQLFNAHQGFYVVAKRGFRQDFSSLGTSPLDSHSACGRSALERARVVIEDVELDETFAPLREAARAEGFRAVQSTPLFARNGDLLGLISTHFREPHRPSERDLRWTDLYAQQAAAMIERKRTDEALRRSEFYLAEGQKISQTGSWGVKLDTLEVFSSDENLRIFGLDPAVAKPTYEGYFELMHPEDREMVQRRFDQAREQLGNFEAQYRVIWPDKTVRSIHSMARPLFDERGQLIEFVGMNTDITERKRAEDALRRAQTELAHVNRVMTMGELAASIAHEVNQPLAAVLTSAQACERWLAALPADIQEARASAQRIVLDALRASDVLARIRELLTRHEPVKSALRVDELLREVVSLVQNEARTQQVALRLSLAPELPPVLGDRVQLQQVVLNLVVNAIEAMRGITARARELEIRAERDGSARVRVSVRDSGPGLPPANRERIFDAFYTTKAQGMGMGMGLAISTSIVTAHGGQLWATPNADAGETFQFTLPIAAS